MKEKVIFSSEEKREELFDWFGGELESVFIDETERKLFLLAFVEAVNNAAEHGNKADPDKRIEINFFLKKGFSCVSVADEGEGFDPVFPDLKKVQSRRGRGLGFIKANTDHLFFNKKGNRVTFFKGDQTMNVKMNAKLGNVEAVITITPNRDVLISKLKTKKANKLVLAQEIGEFFDLLSPIEKKAIFIDLKSVRILTSLAWGTIFAEAERKDIELIHLFNANEAVRATAKQMGIEERKDHCSKIKVFAGQEAINEILKTLN